MRYLVLAYGQQAPFEKMTPEEMETTFGKAKSHDAEMKRTGAYVGAASLGWESTALRQKNGKLEVTDGPFIETKDLVGGLVFIEARDLNEAIRIASMHPAARIGEELGWGIELRPVQFCEMEVILGESETSATRSFDAPKDRVLRAWTDAAALAAWWGPKGFTNEFHVFEPRAGGTWKFDMVGPDGKRYPNECKFEEVTPERIVMEHVGAPHFRVTAKIVTEGPRTRMTFTQRFDSPEECKALLPIVVHSNEENMDRLAAQLARMD